MPHQSELAAQLGTLRGDGVVVREGTRLKVDPNFTASGALVLYDQTGLALFDENGLELQDAE